LDQAGNTNSMLGCIAAEKGRWEIRLGNAYKRLMASGDFSTETKHLLSEAQELWNTFQDKSCDANASLDIQGGTGFNLAKAGCTLRMTADRAVELESHLRLPDAGRPAGTQQRQPDTTKSNR
jgi:uncharacterized protein YecT (DUF1311 family)